MGRSYDRISTVKPTVTDMTFTSATGYSRPKLNTVFMPASLDARFAAFRSDMNFVVQIMTSESSNGAVAHSFAWRYDTDDYFQPQQSVESYINSNNLLPLVDPTNGPTGVYIYFDPIKLNTPDMTVSATEMAKGDVYTFTLHVESAVSTASALDMGDSNTLHQLLECSGRGSCDSDSGKCTCLPGYTGEACQRST